MATDRRHARIFIGDAGTGTTMGSGLNNIGAATPGTAQVPGWTGPAQTFPGGIGGGLIAKMDGFVVFGAPAMDPASSTGWSWADAAGAQPGDSTWTAPAPSQLSQGYGWLDPLIGFVAAPTPPSSGPSTGTVVGVAAAALGLAWWGGLL